MGSSDSGVGGRTNTASGSGLHDDGKERLKVGVSDAHVTDRDVVLVTSGLGSCLGVALYDPTTGIGGLLHAMLPESADHPGPPEKFVVEGIDEMLAALDRAGASRRSIRAKLAGASSMLDLETESASVGEQNVAAAERALDERNVPIEGSDTGGSNGRSLKFEPAAGELAVSSADGDRRVL
ncbi:chemotaxis protein CheD [Halobaculum sp. MBLA0147]|uniref:chemotaxis protein CheD n=1 Tax=Halobaculum sp. MBLA0147 TaxID=3079934 RepID=UPI0035245697